MAFTETQLVSDALLLEGGPIRLSSTHSRTSVDDQKLTLTSFPPEIHLQIFDQLSNSKDPITSACLGLTCKAFYKFHKKNYPLPLPLQYFTEEHHHLRGQVQLFQLFRSSMNSRYNLELLNDPWTGPMRWMFMTDAAWERYKNHLKVIELMEKLHNY